jgi:hypothetical protein
MTSSRRTKRHRRVSIDAPPSASAQTAEEKTFARLKRALRKAERRAGDGSAIGGTGATILKLLPPPLARLLDKGRIGTEEVRAADEIAVAFHAQAGALRIKPPSLERRDATYHGGEPVFVIDAVARYKRWAAHSTRSMTFRCARPTSRPPLARCGANTTRRWSRCLANGTPTRGSACWRGRPRRAPSAAW